MKRYTIFMLAPILLLMAVGCGNETGESSTSSAIGFNSPEDAVVAYLEGLRDSDLDRMINAFAIEIYIENYDFEAFSNRMRWHSPMQDVRMPNINEFVTAMNIENRRATIIDGIIFQYIFLSYPEFDALSVTFIDEGEESDFVREFSDNLNDLDLSSIEIIGFIPPEALTELYQSEINQNNIANQTGIVGVGELVNQVAAFELDGNKYLLAVEVGNYNGQWYLLNLGGNVSALLGIGVYQQGIMPVDSIDDLELDLEVLIVPY